MRAIGKAQGGPLHAAHTKNLTFPTAVWLPYPVVFAIGPEGARPLSAPGISWAIPISDAAAKVVYACRAFHDLDQAMAGRRA